MKTRTMNVLLIAAVLGGILITPSSSSAEPLLKEPSTDIDPSDFVREVDNEFFPLKPGTTFFYEGATDGVPTSNEVYVTRDIKNILGVKCTVVRDRVYENGVLVEETFDWYAQDEDGNVWYFGEDSKDLDPDGNVISTEGSWEAGVGGAMPGIIMLADPHVGDRYHQEFAPGVAEDMAQVLSLDKSACVRYGCFDDLLLTKEWTPLERGVLDRKYYAEDVGFILGVLVAGGDEHIELARITTEK